MLAVSARTLPEVLEPTAIQKLIDSAGFHRDKAILMLLSRAVSASAIGVRLLADTGSWAWHWRTSIASDVSSPCG